MIYLFTICEYGGGEIAWCTLTCEEDFADGFELGVRMRLNEDVHYIVREEIGEEDLAGHTATVGPWTKQPEALERSDTPRSRPGRDSQPELGLYVAAKSPVVAGSHRPVLSFQRSVPTFISGSSAPIMWVAACATVRDIGHCGR